MSKLKDSYIGFRFDILKHIIGNSLIVLDIGCATGTNGCYLKDKKIADIVIGIEHDKNMADIAKKKIDQVIEADLNFIDIKEILFNYKFDYIILGDIIEHVINPQQLLEQSVALLKNDGKILISVPNIQHIETFIQLYVNSLWPVNERGIFDRSHLRFFTLKNIINLINKVDLEILLIERNFRYRDAIGSTFPKYTKKILILLFPNIFTFQYIISCRIRKGNYLKYNTPP